MLHYMELTSFVVRGGPSASSSSLVNTRSPRNGRYAGIKKYVEEKNILLISTKEFFSCEDAAQQVLMYVCPCVDKLKRMF